MIMAQSIGKSCRIYPEHSRGISTLELVIALAVLALSFTAIILVSYGQQLVSIDSELAQQALLLAKKELINQRQKSLTDFNGLFSTSTPITTTPDYENIFNQELTVLDSSPCLKSLTNMIKYQIGSRWHEVRLTSQIGSRDNLIKLGLDCLDSPLVGDWSNLSELNTLALLDPGTPISLDVLDGQIYVATSQGLHLINTTSPHLGRYLADEDGFNDLDAARDLTTNRTYIYLARATTTAPQLLVAEDTGSNLNLIATKSLNDPDGIPMPGWRLVYYDQRIYLGTREYSTTKPEFYIFDVSNPTSPVEIGNYNVNTSIYGIAIRETWDGGGHKKLAYLVTTHDDKEVMVLDVSAPSNIRELIGARTNLPGGWDGRSLYLHGSILFIGLESGGSDDLYALDASAALTTAAGFPILDSVELRGTALSLRASGNHLFLSKIVGTNQVEVWDISEPSNLQRLSTLPIANLLRLDLDENNLYAITSSAPAIHVIKNN